MSLVVETKRASAKMELGPAPPPRHKAPLALPEFDDSDSDDDSHALEDVPPAIETSSNNQSDFKWDGISDIQSLKHQNAELVAAIKSHKQQINELQLLLEALEPIPGLDVDAFKDILQGSEIVDHDIRNVKIVHQAKKLRQATLAYNKEKTRAAAASTKMAEMERAVEAAQTLQLKAERALQRLQQQPRPDVAKKVPSPEKEVAASKKLEELKLKCEAQAVELKRTQRALQREVGDDVALSDILDASDSGKRGRAQQIVMLKAKIKKLERAQPSPVDVPRDVDRKAEDDLAASKLERRKQSEKLLEDGNALREGHEKLHKKYEATKARLHVFEKESSKSKVKISVLLEKSKNDDLLIDRLQSELETKKPGPSSRARTADSKAPDGDELDALKLLCKDQKRQLAHQASLLESFQRDLHAAQSTDLKHTKASVSKEQFGNYQALAIEKERLVELVKSLQQQLQAAKLDAPPKPSGIPHLRNDASRSRLPSPRTLNDVAELDRLRLAVEAKDEEIATWKRAYEAAVSDKVSCSEELRLLILASQTSTSQHSHLIADLEEENAALKDECLKLQNMVRAARKREETRVS
ncbi:hypothetical protein SDRG_01907 [Saprolegnia diclina VS20]|uniref:Uncharacterized protein n=1 Tax=Saprolegnia diclina (strain VS20) TaxID=1156394 RepID=T0R3B0_SAPDV|nr:hypothetical protein SDRG_01907 [Saprolegnia diclina VS20]EQC40840.1 hypothetical protein SDRG_01907 [Saprolegnia diclina VS20]|eukprot:XP_008605684.1 hypothetical protein SDRG_01907 [Saprolegnia diclina VS20]